MKKEDEKRKSAPESKFPIIVSSPYLACVHSESAGTTPSLSKPKNCHERVVCISNAVLGNTAKTSFDSALSHNLCMFTTIGKEIEEKNDVLKVIWIRESDSIFSPPLLRQGLPRTRLRSSCRSRRWTLVLSAC